MSCVCLFVHICVCVCLDSMDVYVCALVQCVMLKFCALDLQGNVQQRTHCMAVMRALCPLNLTIG